MELIEINLNEIMIDEIIHVFQNYLFYRDNKLASILNNSSEVNSLGKDDSNEDEPFEANLINSTVYIIAMSLQVSTFAINYRVSCIFHCMINNIFNMIIN